MSAFDPDKKDSKIRYNTNDKNYQTPESWSGGDERLSKEVVDAPMTNDDWNRSDVQDAVKAGVTFLDSDQIKGTQNSFIPGIKDSHKDATSGEWYTPGGTGNNTFEQKRSAFENLLKKYQ